MKLHLAGIIQWFILGLGAMFYLALTRQSGEGALDSVDGKVCLGIFIASSLLMVLIFGYADYMLTKGKQ